MHNSSDIFVINLYLHAGHTRLLLNSLVPSSSQKISFFSVKATLYFIHVYTVRIYPDNAHPK